MDYVVTEQRRGKLLKLNFAIIFKQQSGEKISETFNIDDLVEARFKFVSSWHTVAIFLSFKQCALAKDSIVSADVRSEVLNYSQHWTCREHWVDWQAMGHKDYQTKIDNNMIVIPINITAITGKSFIAENIFDDSDWTDFILTAADGSVAVHKACLAAHSDVFKRLLAREWQETLEGRIQIEGVSLQTLKYLKQYMYLGTVPDNEDDGLRPLLLIANCYLIDNLRSACISRLARTVKPEKLEDLINFAVDNKITELILAMLQLTPDNVVHGAYGIKQKEAKEPTSEQADGDKE